MIEWLKDDRVLLYKSQSIRGADLGAGSSKKPEKVEDHERPTIEWKFVKRMKFMDSQFGSKDFLEFVSPDFTKFVSVNAKRGTYVIRDMLGEEEEVLHPISPHLMSFEGQNSGEMILKFKWVSDDMFKILSKEGMEKIVDISTDFRQENFNQVSDYNHSAEMNRNYYYNRECLEPPNVIGRLVRKNQQYKSAHHMKDSEYLF
jgi:hypothetical protein